MYILSCFFRKYAESVRKASTVKPLPNFQDDEHFASAKLAANSCVALAKAHCAVVHTEGDLLLMSSYTRGTVPIERQLAQMLHEVPHHVNTKEGSVLYPKGVYNDCDWQQSILRDNPFFLTELSLQYAEEVAKSVNALVHDQIDINLAIFF